MKDNTEINLALLDYFGVKDKFYKNFNPKYTFCIHLSETINEYLRKTDTEELVFYAFHWDESPERAEFWDTLYHRSLNIEVKKLEDNKINRILSPNLIQIKEIK